MSELFKNHDSYDANAVPKWQTPAPKRYTLMKQNLTHHPLFRCTFVCNRFRISELLLKYRNCIMLTWKNWATNSKRQNWMPSRIVQPILESRIFRTFVMSKKNQFNRLLHYIAATYSEWVLFELCMQLIFTALSWTTLVHSEMQAPNHMCADA